MNDFLKKLSQLLFLIINIVSAASIQGVVRDKETKAPLIGANVFIEETSQGSATDVEGSYLIESINAFAPWEHKYILSSHGAHSAQDNTQNEIFVFKVGGLGTIRGYITGNMYEMR